MLNTQEQLVFCKLLKDIGPVEDTGVVPGASTLLPGKPVTKQTKWFKHTLQSWFKLLRVLPLDTRMRDKTRLCAWSAGTKQYHFCEYGACPVCTARLIVKLTEQYAEKLPIWRKRVVCKHVKKKKISPSYCENLFRIMRLQYDMDDAVWWPTFQFYVGGDMKILRRRDKGSWEYLETKEDLQQDLLDGLFIIPEVYKDIELFNFFNRTTRYDKRYIHYGRNNTEDEE